MCFVSTEKTWYVLVFIFTTVRFVCCGVLVRTVLKKDRVRLPDEISFPGHLEKMIQLFYNSSGHDWMREWCYGCLQFPSSVEPCCLWGLDVSITTCLPPFFNLALVVCLLELVQAIIRLGAADLGRFISCAGLTPRIRLVSGPFLQAHNRWGLVLQALSPKEPWHDATF